MRLCASLFRGVAAPLGCVICLQLGDVAVFSLCAQYFLNVRGGGGITTLGPFRTFTNIPGPGVRTACFAAFWPWSDVLPKNAESLRNSDVLMRVAVTRRRGPAGLRDPIAVSLAALMGFTVLLSRFVGTQKIERLFFSYSGAFFEPLFASIHARNLSFGTTIRLPILSAGNSLPCTNS